MFGGYIVVLRPCNHGGVLPKKDVFCFENSNVKIHCLTAPMVSYMLRTIGNGSSCFLYTSKYHILPRKCFLVTSSYSDHVTTAGFSLKKKYFLLKI